MNYDEWRVQQVKKVVELITGVKIDIVNRSPMSSLTKSLFCNICNIHFNMKPTDICEYLKLSRFSVYHHCKRHGNKFDKKYNEYYSKCLSVLKETGIIYVMPLSDQLKMHLQAVDIIEKQIGNKIKIAS